jgi:hypothetical protein
MSPWTAKARNIPLVSSETLFETGILASIYVRDMMGGAAKVTQWRGISEDRLEDVSRRWPPALDYTT